MYSHHTFFSKTFVYFNADIYWLKDSTSIPNSWNRTRIIYSFFLIHIRYLNKFLFMTSIFCSHVDSLPLGDLLPVWRWSTAPPVSNEIAFFCRASDNSDAIKWTHFCLFKHYKIIINYFVYIIIIWYKVWV